MRAKKISKGECSFGIKKTSRAHATRCKLATIGIDLKSTRQQRLKVEVPRQISQIREIRSEVETFLFIPPKFARDTSVNFYLWPPLPKN